MKSDSLSKISFVIGAVAIAGYAYDQHAGTEAEDERT
jgi:hypothetical protein